MKLRDCYGAVIEEMISTGERLTTEQVRVRALDLNGAADEFNAHAAEKAAAAERRVISAMLKDLTEVVSDDDDPQQQLFSLLPFRPTRALALPAEDGEHRYVAFAHSTPLDRQASLRLKEENIQRAARRLLEDQANHEYLERFSLPDMTATEALTVAAERDKAA